MKKIFVAIFALVSLNTFAQRWETIKGNGVKKTETRELTDFTGLSSQGSINVEITFGNSNSLSLEADENLLPYIETVVENKKLVIRTKKNVNISSGIKMVAHVSMTQINFLSQSGSGNVIGTGAFTNDGKTNISVSGSGNIKLGFSNFGDLDLSISGSGNMEFQSGTTGHISAAISGSGNIDCSNVTSKDVNARISGSGNIKVNVSNSIEAKIAGSGSIYYKGDATNINSKIAGSGRVVKMKS